MKANLNLNTNSKPLGRVDHNQRMDRLETVLDERSVKLASLSPEEQAANRSFGAKVLSDIDRVQSSSPESESVVRTENGSAEMADFYGYGMNGFPEMAGMGSLMMMFLIEQYMNMMLMLLMMQAGMDPSMMPGGMPGPFPGGGGQIPLPEDVLDDGGTPRPFPDGGGQTPLPEDVLDDGGTPRPFPGEDGTSLDGVSEDGVIPNPIPGDQNRKSKRMTPVRATQILKQYFDLLDTAAGIGKKDGIIGKPDLEAAAQNPDLPKELKEALAYLLANPAVLNAVDVGAGEGRVDGLIGKKDLDKFMEDHSGKEGYDVLPEGEVDGGPSPSDMPDSKPIPFRPESSPESNADALAAQQDAIRIHQAVSGVGTDEDTLTRLLGGRSNKEIQAIKSAYQKSYGKALEQVVRSETSGHLETLLLALLSGRASESEPVDRFQVGRDVEALHKAVSGLGTDEKTLITILATRSKKHLKEVSEAYEEIYEEKLSEAIKGDTSGHLEKGLLQNL